MLQLQTQNIDICRISKLLVKHNIKASITDSAITLDGDVSDELLTQLCGDININAVQNFISKEPLYLPKETSSIQSNEHLQNETVEESEKIEPTQSVKILSHNLPEYDLIYPEVKRGQVYWCDLGTPYAYEAGYMRPVIVISKDCINKKPKHQTVTVIPCTTTLTNYSDRYCFNFSNKTMLDYHPQIPDRTNCANVSIILTVNKFQLRKFIGTMTPEFMDKMQEIIDDALSLRRDVKTIAKTEKVYVDRPVHKKTIVDSKAPKERKDMNMIQVQLLSFVDINELIKISQSYHADEVKAQRILELFGFDFKKNGVQYLLKAIIASPKDTYFNLETLCEAVSKKEGIDKEEIKRLIVARVKETFGFKKAPTIDFIRLVNNFLVKQEANYEKTNI